MLYHVPLYLSGTNLFLSEKPLLYHGSLLSKLVKCSVYLGYCSGIIVKVDNILLQAATPEIYTSRQAR